MEKSVSQRKKEKENGIFRVVEQQVEKEAAV